MTEQHRKDTSLDTSLATSLLSIRNWLEAALEAKGAKVEGAGVGFGQADLDFALEGRRYSVSIRPLPDDSGEDSVRH